ncbi:hypothetical protein WUBG_14563 [Wuchereria bancrofti]|uniref:Uncharacterized protein n=1 Tax=Wuchereria bancrofti TaxID=6293 RepID=J9DXU9_WUCBA|nr:hypothetical protein WUBG_14563 [Wuchereria bancrofti]
MLWIHRRFLSRCADLLRTETARIYFEVISSKLKALKRNGNDESRINNSASVTHLETVTTLAHKFYDKLEMLTQLDMLLKGSTISQNSIFYKYISSKIKILLFKEGNDPEIQEIAKLDSEQLMEELDSVVNKLTDAIIPVTEYDLLNNCQLEITPLVST